MLPTLVVDWRASALRAEEAGRFRKVACLRDPTFSSIHSDVHNQIKAGVPFDVFKYVCMSKVVEAGGEWKWERDKSKEGEGRGGCKVVQV